MKDWLEYSENFPSPQGEAKNLLMLYFYNAPKEFWKDKGFILEICKLCGLWTVNFIDGKFWNTVSKDEPFQISLYSIFKNSLDSTWGNEARSLSEFIPWLKPLRENKDFQEKVFDYKKRLEMAEKAADTGKLITNKNFYDIAFTYDAEPIKMLPEEANALIKRIVQKVTELKSDQNNTSLSISILHTSIPNQLCALKKLIDASATYIYIDSSDLLKIFQDKDTQNFLIDTKVVSIEKLEYLCEFLKENVNCKQKFNLR